MENKLGGGFGVIIQSYIKNISFYIVLYQEKCRIKSKKNDSD